jgi:glutathione S-transferase
VTIKPLDMMKGETRTPEFLALNPNHTCPTLEYETGKAIIESNAILRYVANAAKAEHVYPTEPIARAHVDSALDWQSCSAKFIGAVAYPHLGFGGTVESATAAHAALTE